MKIIGIDYGHGETSAGYVDSETTIANEIRLKDLKIVGDKIVIPSIVCKYGDEFVIDPSPNQIAKAEGLGISFKAPLVGNDSYGQITEENKTFFKAFLSKVYVSTISNSNNPLHIDNNGNKDFKIYIACPSGWDDTQIKAYKKFVLDECQIPLMDIVKESRAAYIAARRTVGGGISTQGGNVLVIDFGSSTIDFTFFNNDLKFDPIHEGYPYGASQVERDVIKYIVDTNPEAKKNLIIVEERCGKIKADNSLLFAMRKEKEKYFSEGNVDYFNPSIDLKHLLMSRSYTGMYIEPIEENGFSKSQLTKVILKEYIKLLSNMLDDFKRKEGVSSIDTVILTGGASRMFFFKELVSEKYGVSKENQTLIVDLEPSLTISRGIAAFGFMKERSLPAEKNLKDAVSSFINKELKSVLQSAINKALSDFYCKELTKIILDYEYGNIKDESGKRSVYALKKAFESFLRAYKAGATTISRNIAPSMNFAISKSVKERLLAYVNTWSYNETDIKVEFEFNNSFSLTPGTIQLMSEKCAKIVENSIITLQKILEDLLGVFSELLIDIVDGFIDILEEVTGLDIDPEFKDRGLDGRKRIVRKIKPKIIATCKTLKYDGPLSDECQIIGDAIRSKIKDIIDKAELEMYK